VQVHDLFAVKPTGDTGLFQREALGSFSIWGFYSTLGLAIGIVWWTTAH